MTDTRQVLEEAWEHLCQTSLSFRRYACTTIPGGDGWTMTGKFYRFLDAEAWTDAALILVPEGKCWHIRYDPRLTGATVMDQDGFNQHHTLAETPALALLEACLEARENADG